jgi:hypothetical protein
LGWDWSGVQEHAKRMIGDTSHAEQEEGLSRLLGYANASAE